MLKNSILKSQLHSFKKAFLLKRVSSEGIRLIYLVTNTNRHMLNKYLVAQTWVQHITYSTTFCHIKSLCLQISLTQIPKHFPNLPGAQLYSILCNNVFVSIQKWNHLYLVQTFWTNNWYLIINYFRFFLKIWFKIYLSVLYFMNIKINILQVIWALWHWKK